MTHAVDVDVVVIGGGQAGLSAGYHLRRQNLDFVILDAQPSPGGAWQHTWDSLRLFSPAAYSSLPGWLMPSQDGWEYPDARHVVQYLSAYEERYALPVERPVQVSAVRRDKERLRVETDAGVWSARAVVSATGTWWRPFLPAVPGRETFTGRQLHTVQYRNPDDFAGRRIIVVGGGNSGAQIAADLAPHTDLTWVTQRPARYLADDIDGRALFDAATARRRALDTGDTDTGASPRSAISSPSRRSAPYGMPASSRPSRCSPASPRTARSGWTAPEPKLPKSSGAPAFAPRLPTLPRWACEANAAASPPTALVPSTNLACTSSATATGRVPHRPH